MACARMLEMAPMTAVCTVAVTMGGAMTAGYFVMVIEITK